MFSSIEPPIVFGVKTTFFVGLLAASIERRKNILAALTNFVADFALRK